MMGLVATELMILAIAVLSAKASGFDLRQVFRVKRSTGTEWLGSLTIYLGAFFGTATVSYLLAFFFPEVLETSQEISGFILSGGFVLALIAVSLLPGLCEEAWHRGYLLTTLGSLKSVAARVIIMGIVFGLFHLDQTRFLQTMILGFALSFMRIKTDNLLIPIAYHMLNNLISLALTFGLTQLYSSLPEQTLLEVQAASSQMPVGILLPLLVFTASLCALFVVLGRYIFKRVDARREAQETATH
jgi:membrane protease YdiL (CAAX protease family)